MPKWTLLKITATVETKEKGTLEFDFDGTDYLKGVDPVTKVKLIHRIGEKVAIELEE